MEKVANKVTSEVGVGSNKKVFLPKTGELVDATTESYIYQVRLPDALMSQLSFQHAKDNAYLSWVDGALTYQQSGMSKCVFEVRTYLEKNFSCSFKKPLTRETDNIKLSNFEKLE